MNTRGLLRQLLFYPITVLGVGGVGFVWLLPNILEKNLLDQTAADLTAKTAVFARALTDSGYTPSFESAERLCKTVYQSTGTRFTVFLQNADVVVDSISQPERRIELGRYPEVRAARAGETGKRLIHDAYLGERQMAIALATNLSQPDAPIVRAAASLALVDETVARFRLLLGTGLVVLAALCAGYSFRLSKRFRRSINSLEETITRFSRKGMLTKRQRAVNGEWSSIAEKLNRMADVVGDRMRTIAHQRNELETVLSSMREGVFAVDPDDRILNINRAAADMFECDRETAPGKSIQEVIRNLQLQRFVSRASASVQSLEEDVTFYGGGEVILNLRSSAMLNADRQRIGTLIVMADVTRLRRLESMRSDFVANVSHEIKTPLTAIKGFVETLYNRQVDSPEETERFLGIIIKHVNRLDAIVLDLLSLSRIEESKGRQELHLKKTRIRDIIATAVQVLQAKAETKDISLIVRDEEDAWATVDATLLEQAILNLMDNAIKYSDPGGKVEVGVATRSGEISIQVKDRGAGIAKRHLPRLFERFYRVDKARSRNLGGTGLGLAIVKHITQAHGGEVSVDSTLGGGTTFTLQIPVS